MRVLPAGAARRRAGAANLEGQPVGVAPIDRGSGWSRSDLAELFVQPAAHGGDTAAKFKPVAGEDQGAGEFHRSRPQYGAVGRQSRVVVALARSFWVVHTVGSLQHNCVSKWRQYESTMRQMRHQKASPKKGTFCECTYILKNFLTIYRRCVCKT